MEMMSMPPISPVVLITGEGDQGQNLVAMAYVEIALHEERRIFHTGCSNEGARITRNALSSDQRLATLMHIVPEGSTFILADADCLLALASVPGQSKAEWLDACRSRKHTVVLTTVRGREAELQTVIGNIDTSHLVVEAGHDPTGIFVTGYWGELRERFPMASAFIEHESVMRWAKADGWFLHLALSTGLRSHPSPPQFPCCASAL